MIYIWLPYRYFYYISSKTIEIDWTGICKSSYHTITTTTVLDKAYLLTSNHWTLKRPQHITYINPGPCLRQAQNMAGLNRLIGPYSRHLDSFYLFGNTCIYDIMSFNYFKWYAFNYHIVTFITYHLKRK